ncbi:MAG TPA: hypothetical protein VIM11_22340 [Tepidisphaeraceae bacterium]|jgi:hypothetical protein
MFVIILTRIAEYDNHEIWQSPLDCAEGGILGHYSGIGACGEGRYGVVPQTIRKWRASEKPSD